MPSITITDADVAAAGAIRSDRTNPMVAGTYNLTIDEWCKKCDGKGVIKNGDTSD